jgi:predicted phosphodiesterase
MPEHERRELWTTRGRVLVGAFVGAAAALLGLRLIPQTSHPLGPAEIGVRADLGRGRTILTVPPIGTVHANTHSSPLSLSLMVTQLDPNALAEAVGSEDQEAFVASITKDLNVAAVRAGVALFAGGIIIGALAAALLPGRRWGSVVAGAIGAGGAIGALLLFTMATFDVQAFREPSFTGTLSRAPQVIQAVEHEIGALHEFPSRLEQAAERLSQVLALLAQPSRVASGDSTAILHISDIHSNPVGLEIAAQLVRHFDVAAVLDTGDLTSFGEPMEGQIARRIARIPVPYIFVPGNHDSRVVRSNLAQATNVTLLHDQTMGLAGLEILGWADPTVTSFGEISTGEANAIRTLEAERVGDAVLDAAPDILAIHDGRLARDAVGDVPLILAGHTHERSFAIEDESITMTVGSTGATGLGSFLVESDARYEAQVLYFEDRRLIASDYISFAGLGGDFTVERRTVTNEATGDFTDRGRRTRPS